MQLDDNGATGANANGLDAVQRYTLEFTGVPKTPHGYHVKLMVETPETVGRSDRRCKVFWVEPCQTPGTPDTPDTPDTPEVEGEQQVDTPQGDHEVEVLGEQATAPSSAAAVPSAVDAGLGSADRSAVTAMSTTPLLAVYGLVLTAFALVVRRARRA